MKKVININFQGRVIPIEETAFETLKQYVESLRLYFAKEEGKEEIINDIQDRIAELFTERLKQGATCITDEDVTVVIKGMGRPEDFEDAEERASESAYTVGTSASSQAHFEKDAAGAEPRGRLYRNDADKVIGGVCSGLANYLRIDPVVVRILFAIITFGGFGSGLLIYIVLWIVLPAKGLETTIRKRLYRSPDDRMISGVCGGAAAYFNLNVWIPRLIFAAPFLVGIIVSVFRSIFFEFDPFPVALFNSFGGTMLIIYVILWAVVPEAKTATEKLEMRGEKIDLESIKNTVQDELNSLKDRAMKAGTEFSEKAQQWGQDLKQNGDDFAKEAAPVLRKTSTGFGHAIGVVFKAFFLFIAGIIAFSLLMSLLAVFVGGVSMLSIKAFFLEGFRENLLAWATLFFFIGVPILSMVTWIIRRIIGVKSKSKYLGYIFGSLWLLGLISAILLGCSIGSRYKVAARVRDNVTIIQPASHKLLIKVTDGNVRTYGGWFQWDGMINLSDDSILLSRVDVKILRSEDSSFHVTTTRFSRGDNERKATANAEQIKYQIIQEDSVLYLDRGFSFGPDGHFRDQKLVVTIRVPVGKRILIDRTVQRRLKNFSIESGPDGDWEYEWHNDMGWDTDVEYVMTTHGLERTDGARDTDDSEDNSDENQDNGQPKENKAVKPDTLKKSPGQNEYRYHKTAKIEALPEITGDAGAAQSAVSMEDMNDNVSSAIYRIVRLF